MLPPRITAAKLFGLALLWSASSLRAEDDRLQRVIENVRANEALYQNIEAHAAESYTMYDPDGLSETEQIKSSTRSARSVRQGQFLYFNRDETMKNGDGKTIAHPCQMGYDGEYTRRLQGKTANLIHGPYGHCQLFRSHAWLLFGARVCFPLSIWLAGGKELQNQPGAGGYKDYWLQKTFYEKEEVVDGLHTVKLRVESRLIEDPSQIVTIRHLWLAIDRNYLPVKTEGFDPSWSKTLAREVGHVSDFREIAPGVWQPFQRSTVTYCQEKLRENKQVVANVQEATLKKVDLNPQYDISLFRDIPFPDGTQVYEVKDDKIINKYIQGEKPHSHSTLSRRWRWWLLVGSTLIGCWLVYLKYFSKRNRAPAT